MILLVISQFTGLYYTIDANNVYHRSPGYMIGMIIPMVVLVLQLSLIIQYRNHFRLGLFLSLILFLAVVGIVHRVVLAAVDKQGKRQQ